MLEDKAMEDEFKHSLENNCFEVWYQPKYDPETERMVGAEGLIRWRDEKGNVIPPGKFIPLFERDGLIKVLDEYVFRKVCMQQLEWQKQGKEIIPVSINLSRASLYFDSVVSRYQQIADEIGVKTIWFRLRLQRAQQLTMTISRGWQISSMTMVFHCL